MASPSLSEGLGGTPEAAEFGAALRDMRLAHNADLSSVASTLRIRQVYLHAIEDGRFGDLPGPTYAAGFVRAYAEYLGLEIPEVMRRYREITRDGATQAPLVAPSPVSEGRMPTGFILLMAAVLAGVAYGTWYYLTLNGRDAGDLVAQIPQKIADIVGMDRSSGETPTPSNAAAPPAPVVAQPAAPVVAQPAAPAPAQPAAPPAEPPAQAAAPASPDPAPAPQESAAEATPVTPRTAPAAAAAPEPRPMPQPPESESTTAAPNAVTTVPLPTESVSGDAAVGSAPTAETAPSAGGDAMTPVSAPAAEAASAAPAAALQGAPEQVAAVPPAAPAISADEAPGRVVLRANAISWVELRDSAGKRIFSRLLKKGETYNVPASTGITLATGNAGALDILVDGRAITPIGPSGAVRRDVLLEPDALLGRGATSQ